jgi:hypothetical protein
MKRYTASYLIAYHLGWDQSEVSEGLYQRARNPSLYVCGDHYFCAPTERQTLPKPYEWEAVGEYYGRKVYRAA